MDDDKITVSRAEARAFFHKWETDARESKTLTQKQTRALTVDAVADTNAANFFEFVQDAQEL